MSEMEEKKNEKKDQDEAELKKKENLMKKNEMCCHVEQYENSTYQEMGKLHRQ